MVFNNYELSAFLSDKRGLNMTTDLICNVSRSFINLRLDINQRLNYSRKIMERCKCELEKLILFNNKIFSMSFNTCKRILFCKEFHDN